MPTHPVPVSSATLPLEALSGEARGDAKALGAYYTDTPIARFLVRWAIRKPDDKVIDPSFGGGVFLRAAAEQIGLLGGSAGDSIFGVELDDETHATIGAGLIRSHKLSPNQLLRSDFFAVAVSDLPEMNAVVGNPPFVRYQRFKGPDRLRALNRAAEQNVVLPQLSSSWAPFVVHSTALLADGGRLAFVLPMELGYAGYARPVLSYLAKHFARLHILAFERSLFPKISEETVLLLAETKKQADGRLAEVRLHDLVGPSELEAFDPDATAGTDIGTFIRGQRRLAEFLIPLRGRELYARLQAIGVAGRFGLQADVGIGYVSGNNAFFHPSPSEIENWRLPARFLRPAVLGGSALQGLNFTSADWRSGLEGGDTGHLLQLPPNDSDLPAAVGAYLEHGRRQNVDQAYKCRARTPWHAVPHVHRADGFLTYMSGAMTRLVANSADAVAPNTLHVIRLHRDARLSMTELAARWLTSLTQLSVEIEGHSLGGGMLKLEPTEAERVLIPIGAERTPLDQETVTELDVLLRNGEFDRARTIADDLFLRGELGLSGRECAVLHQSALILRNRRQNRKRPAPI